MGAPDANHVSSSGDAFPGIIEVRELRKVYRGRFRSQGVVALDSLSLSIQPGEIFGLLGPNGAGKTTLLKILLGVVRPTSGSAILDGSSCSSPSARKRVGFLPENHRFPDFLTAARALQIFARLSFDDPAAESTRIPEVLDRVGLLAWRNSRVREFSKGMTQRLGLAQALMGKPKILFLDEPTDGVDPVGRVEIRDILLDMRRDGATIFLNSHMLAEVETICDRVCILDKGRVRKQGNLSEMTGAHGRHHIHISDASGPAAQVFVDQRLASWYARKNGHNVLQVPAASEQELNLWIESAARRRRSKYCLSHQPGRL